MVAAWTTGAGLVQRCGIAVKARPAAGCRALEFRYQQPQPADVVAGSTGVEVGAQWSGAVPLRLMLGVDRQP